jgi:hypothetical protein
MRFSRLSLVPVVAVCALLGAAAPSMAAPSTAASSGGLEVLITGGSASCEQTDLAASMKGTPGIASASSYDVGAATPTAAELAAADIVVDTGASCGNGYAAPDTYGNRLADYLDHGGVLVQVAYDNWNSPGVYPTGRFQSGNYAALQLGENDNVSTQLGTILKPKSPIMKGLGTFSTQDNTTNALAAGATLLAKWADGRNAIATKGRVVTTSASEGDSSDTPDLIRLIVNAGRYFNAVPGTKLTKEVVGVHTARFRYKAIGPYVTGFVCSLTKFAQKPNFKPCPSHKTYRHLHSDVTYLFEVAAVGPGGPDKTPAKIGFRNNSS